ncbi:MAG: tetratricopeptide repeat protein [Alphaproteobacteria bacterium]|nr:tetratricopeptide repeat protein [Alphaproteobacteria bacterium]
MKKLVIPFGLLLVVLFVVLVAVPRAELYRLAAEQGYAPAQYQLGLMYDTGHGLPQDYTKAVRWYRLAADQGHSDAQFNVGAMYYNGFGVPQDYGEALKWFRRGAEQRDAQAQSLLGAMYGAGFGVPQDDTEALKWYRLATKQGDARGQFNLGFAYHEGLGVGQDYAEALKWYRQAAEQGHADAKNHIAWILATAPDSKLRNGALAIRLAQQAVADRADAARIDTLAAANAEAGRFDIAVREQQRAIEMAKQESALDLIPVYESRLALYRRRQPYRE